MFIEARLATDIRPNSVVIPEDAVISLQGVTVAWVVTDGKADRREVTLGVRRPGFVEAGSGVSAGERVVVAGAERLVQGAPVTAKLVSRDEILPQDEAQGPGDAL
jgi:membrane fusion protein (multidrug efflux system)